MRTSGLGFVLCVGALASAAGACGVDYTSLGQQPEGVGTGGGGEGGAGAGAGAGGAGGSPTGPQCAAPNPAGCGEDAPCPQGSVCAVLDVAGCAPSSCQCSESGEWYCTKDCGPTRACVAAPGGGALPASASRVAYGCSPVDAGTQALLVGVGSQSCDGALSYPLLVLPSFVEYDDEGNLEIAVGRTYEFTKAELQEYADFAGVETGPNATQPVWGDYWPSAAGPASQLERGSLTIQTWDGASRVTGRYDVVFADGARLVGDFDVNLCTEQTGFCG